MKKILATFTLLLCLTSCVADSTTSDDVSDSFLEQGSFAPNFDILTSEEAAAFTLNDLRGRYVMIEFWASWCPDCRNVTAAMKDMYAAYASDSLVFVGYSFDTDATTWRDYIATNDLQWVQTCEFTAWKENYVATAYNVKWIPTFYLIDPAGRVAYATIEIDDMSARLKELQEGD